MKLPVTFAFLFLILFSLANAQSNFWFYSDVHCLITNKSESAFLVNCEQKVYKAVVENAGSNKVRPWIFRGYTFGGIDFAVLLSKEEIPEELNGWPPDGDLCLFSVL